MKSIAKKLENEIDVDGLQAISNLAYETAGLVLSPQKAKLVLSRLRHRLRALDIDSLTDYCEYVKADEFNGERSQMISALTTNVSDFFREPHHFDILESHYLPKLAKKVRNGKKVRFWSAGCSRGQEPYSIAMLLHETDPIFERGDCKILATDIDQDVLSFAAEGIYGTNQIGGLSEVRKNTYLDNRMNADICSQFCISQNLKNMITFRHLNLIDDWPMKGSFDAIFCRNVIIYFDSQTQAKLWPKFHERLDPNGVIFVGHSERIPSNLFNSSGPTSYAPISRHIPNTISQTEKER